MNNHTYGHTRSGEPITEAMIEKFAEKAECGYDPSQLRAHRRRPGRPPLGAAAKTVESVRLEPSLQKETAERAAQEGITVSEVIRRALREYLHSA